MVPSLSQLSDFYASQLKEQIAPFWLKHAPDREFGGYFTCLDREGRVYDPDKICMWGAGRIAWTFACLNNEFEPNPAWLDFARIGVDFIRRHGFRSDGRMYYALKRDGAPLAAPMGCQVELSSVLGLAEVARAGRDEGLYEEARRLFDRTWGSLQEPFGSWSPRLKESGAVRMHGCTMAALNALQILRRFREEPSDAARVDECIAVLRRFHLRGDRGILLETVRCDGSDLPGSAGREVSPGHMIQSGIFVAHEARHRSDGALRKFGMDLIRWGFEKGWDREFGGIFTGVDAEGAPIAPGEAALLADSKLWWQHAEALYGLLLAFLDSGDDWFWNAYRQVHEYAFSRFADPGKGEWFAMLDRTGRAINTAKGTDRKNCFHVGRNFIWCHKAARAHRAA